MNTNDVKYLSNEILLCFAMPKGEDLPQVMSEQDVVNEVTQIAYPNRSIN